MSKAESDKRDLLLKYAHDYDCHNFVETGTYKGDTVKAMLRGMQFSQIHTVDIYEDRVQNAKRRFASFDSVTCWHGDSAEVLPKIVQQLDKPTLFWLDAHHSGKQIARQKGLIETPIVAELVTVLKFNKIADSVILIDDARYYEEFPKKYPNYPKTEVLQKMIADKLPDWTWEIKNDIIRCHRVLD